jgi:hypothetical protein
MADDIAGESRRPRADRPRFIPGRISESILISKENEAKISLIETKESPSLESDLSYILATSKKTSFFDSIADIARRPSRLVSEVKTEYFLTYHEKKHEEEPVPRERMRRRKKKTEMFTGDEILQVIRFLRTGIDRHLLVCITDFEVGRTRDSKEFLRNEGFLTVERFIGETRPKWIVIGASASATVQEQEEEAAGEKFLVIPGKINFRFRDRYGLRRYRHRFMAPSAFLRRHPKIRRMARENNVEPVILMTERILVLERIDESPGEIFRKVTRAFRRYDDIRLTLTGSFIFYFGIGIQQGAIVNPILNSIEKLGLLVLLMWIMQYIYPNIVYTTSVILSAVRFDTIKSAEKDEIVERATINLELKKVMLRSAVFSAVSSVLLLVIYPGFFVGHFLDHPFAGPVIAFIFVASAFFRDWPISFEQDALFRILKRSLAEDEELYPSILKINAIASSSDILFNFIGIAVGWLAMSVDERLGIGLTLAGVACACAKLLFPLYGSDYAVACTTNVDPFYASEEEVVIVPDAVSVRSPYRIRMSSRGGHFVFYDEHALEVIVRRAGSLPAVRYSRGGPLSRKSQEWRLSWDRGGRRVILVITLREKRELYDLVREQNDGVFVYSLRSS